MIRSLRLLLLVLVVSSAAPGSAVCAAVRSISYSWREHLQSPAAASWLSAMSLDLNRPEVREALVQVLGHSGLPATELEGIPSAEGQALRVAAALSEYVAGLANDHGSGTRVIQVDSPEDLADLKDEFDALAVIRDSLPWKSQETVRRVQTVLHESLLRRAERAVREIVFQVEKTWLPKTEGRLPAPEDPGGAVFAPAASPKPSASPARTLAEIFGAEKIRTVFNGDAGNGRWQKDILGQAWLDENPVIVGFDLEVPVYYKTAKVAPERDWRDVVVVTHEQDPRFPKDGTVDMAHVAFMEMTSEAWRRRLRHYMRLVREGGFFVIAHNSRYRDSDWRLREEFKPGEWSLQASFDRADAPADYPLTPWWKKFNTSGEQSNYILVFQKRRRTGSPQSVPRLRTGM